MNVKKLDVTVSDTMEKDAVKLLSVLRPSWKREDVKFKVFTEGITNRLLACEHIDDVSKSDVLLLRVYGEKTDLIIDRQLELQNMQLMHLMGCAKPAYAQFNNGIVYGFMEGECLDGNTVREPHIARLIAREMVKMQSLDLDTLALDHPGLPHVDRKPCIFTKTKKYLELLPDEFPDPEKNHRFQTDVPSKSKLCSEIEYIQSHLEVLGSPIVFSHNDLLLKNIVYSKPEDRTYFIDFEYGGFNYEAYDIGNHFCEYAGIHTVDYSLYPDKEYQLGWLRNFLEFKFLNDGKNPEDISAEDLERLYVQANKFTLMAHLFWTVWGLIQARYSSIDFDYLDYAILRLNEFYAKKEEFLSLKMP